MYASRIAELRYRIDHVDYDNIYDAISNIKNILTSIVNTLEDLDKDIHKD